MIGRPYRRVKQLDSYDDTDARRILRNSQKRSGFWFERLVIAFASLFLGCFASLIFVCGFLGTLGEYFGAERVFIFTLPFFVIIPMVMYRVMENSALKRIVKVNFQRPECPACDYPLKGLKPTEGAVICPECGVKKYARPTNCHACGYDLRGLPQDQQVCPECGRDISDYSPL